MPKPPKRKKKLKKDLKKENYLAPKDRPKRLTVLQVITILFTLFMVIVFIVPSLVTLYGSIAR